MMGEKDLQALLEFARLNDRVHPALWDKFWQMLPNKRRKGDGWEPDLPLLNAYWSFSMDDQKIERVAEHIRWGADNGAFEQIDTYLRGLEEIEWTHKDFNAGYEKAEQFFYERKREIERDYEELKRKTRQKVKIIEREKKDRERLSNQNE